MKPKQFVQLMLITSVMILASIPGVRGDDTQFPDGWLGGASIGNEYELVIDNGVFHEGNSSALIKSKVENPKGFGSFTQCFMADEFLGKRLRLTAFVKTENAITGAGLWMRVDSHDSTLSFDNMKNRRIIGSIDWTKYHIVLDVPDGATMICFGMLLTGTGQAWVDDFDFTEVDSSVPTTEAAKADLPTKPINLGFEKND
ncbi:MAG: hypothetical protein GY839_14855 [candidate division Zixibacteria bacterium]|nr:hypothetical protein [candidate division Zixibacteria bacterium]